MKVAFLFPGQGMEKPGMGLDLAARSDHAANLLEHASQVTGVDLGHQLKEGGEDLGRTAVLQPTLTAVALGTYEYLSRSGMRDAYYAGHSLGEVAAWAAAGGIRSDAAVQLAATRGQLMEREASRHNGGMVALSGTRGEMTDALDAARQVGGATLAAHNTPTQWVLSGDPEALDSVLDEYPGVPLRVAGAWHSPHMAGAVQELHQAVQGAGTRKPPKGFVCNQSGKLARRGDMPELLAGQLTRPVHWAGTMSTLDRCGVTDYVTVGPGKVLRGLVRKNLGKQTRIHATDSPEALDQTLDMLTRAAQGAQRKKATA